MGHGGAATAPAPDAQHAHVALLAVANGTAWSSVACSKGHAPMGHASEGEICVLRAEAAVRAGAGATGLGPE